MVVPNIPYTIPLIVGCIWLYYIYIYIYQEGTKSNQESKPPHIRNWTGLEPANKEPLWIEPTTCVKNRLKREPDSVSNRIATNRIGARTESIRIADQYSNSTTTQQYCLYHFLLVGKIYLGFHYKSMPLQPLFVLLPLRHQSVNPQLAACGEDELGKI